jgi:XisI protein
MDATLKTKKYEKAIEKVLNEHALMPAKAGDYSRIVIVDKERQHYMLIATGWATPTRFIDAILIHLQIQSDTTIWLMENNTEIHVRDELVKNGVAYNDIVLAFYPPHYQALMSA